MRQQDQQTKEGKNMVKYRVEYHKGGTMLAKTACTAEEKFLVGDYFEGKPYGPVPDAIAKCLPYNTRASFWRAANGWYVESPFPHWRFDLTRKRDGAPMGTVFATVEK